MKKWLPLLTILILVSCYTQKKAREQFAKATTFDPQIAADYCSRVYPSKDTTIRDTVVTTDTLHLPPEITTDTLLANDTLFITITKTLPGKTITNTIHIRDTVYQKNTADVDACRIDNSRLVGSIDKIMGERDKAKHGRNIWRIIALSALAVIGVGVYFKVKKFFTPKT